MSNIYPIIYEGGTKLPIISKLTGKGVSVDTEKIEEKFQTILIEEEMVQLAFKVIRDMIIFTNKRIILVDVQGVTGKKVEYLTIPYRMITHFSIETAGHLDRDFDLKIWLTGKPHPVERKLKKNEEIAHEVNRIIARYATS